MRRPGWSQTNWAGERPGEIGGLFWRTEPPDPLCSYYGDDIGELTLDDPISFAGTICFTDGMTDSAAFFGYFNDEYQIQKIGPENSDAASPLGSTMGVVIADSSAVGYYFAPRVTAADREVVRTRCGVFTPDRRRHKFSFSYDPRAMTAPAGRRSRWTDGSMSLISPPSSEGPVPFSTASGWRTSAAAGIRSSSISTT